MSQKAEFGLENLYNKLISYKHTTPLLKLSVQFLTCNLNVPCRPSTLLGPIQRLKSPDSKTSIKLLLKNLRSPGFISKLRIFLSPGSRTSFLNPFSSFTGRVIDPVDVF